MFRTLRPFGFQHEDRHTANEPRRTSYPSGGGPDIPTIVVVGNTGVGKSSVINLLKPSDEPRLGRGMSRDDLAEVGHRSMGCTSTPSTYDRIIGSRRIRLVDTAGLNEGEDGCVPMHEAVSQLHHVLTSQPNGVSLVVFVMPVGRITLVDENVYQLIRLLCGPEVPVALVLTKGDTLPVRPGEWWERARRQYEDAGMRYVGPVLVISSRGLRGMYEEEHDRSVRLFERFIHRTLTPSRAEREAPTWFISPYSRERELIQLIRRLLLRGGGNFHQRLRASLEDMYEDRWGSEVNVPHGQLELVSLDSGY